MEKGGAKAHLAINCPNFRVTTRHDLGVETNKVGVIARIILLASKLERPQDIPLDNGEKGVERDHLHVGNHLVLPHEPHL